MLCGPLEGWVWKLRSFLYLDHRKETAVAVLKMGAQGYLMKSNLSRLIPAVQRELREAEERKHSRCLEQQVHQLLAV